MAILSGVTHDEIREMVEEGLETMRARAQRVVEGTRDDRLEGGDIRALVEAFTLQVLLRSGESVVRRIAREEALAAVVAYAKKRGTIRNPNAAATLESLDLLKATRHVEITTRDPGAEARAARADVDARARALETRSEVQRLFKCHEGVILRSAAKTPEGAVPAMFRVTHVSEDADGLTVELRGDARLPDWSGP